MGTLLLTIRKELLELLGKEGVVWEGVQEIWGEALPQSAPPPPHSYRPDGLHYGQLVFPLMQRFVSLLSAPGAGVRQEEYLSYCA